MSFSNAWVFVFALLVVGCGGQQASEPESFIGTISEMDAEGTSMTIAVPDSATGMEPGPVTLTLADTTEVLKSFMAMPLDSLQVDQDVRVEAIQEDNAYIPSRIILLDN
jgi:hypothetical protein